jgi:hypothetical protein
MGLKIFESFSPEYALDSAYQDMNESGVDGLKKHLTKNALKNLESFESISKAPGISQLTDALLGGNAVSVFLDKLSECKWTTKEVLKGSETSKAIVGFNYNDMMIGTMEMKLIKEDKIWKIDGLEMPKFEKFDIPETSEE